MHIVYFLTYGYSLKTWQDSGNLDRELKFMEYLNINFNHTFTLITYGDEDDESDEHDSRSVAFGEKALYAVYGPSVRTEEGQTRSERST